MLSQLELYDFESRLQRPLKVKIQDFQVADRLRHVILVSQFTPTLLERLSRSADRIRLLAKSKDGNLFLNSLLSHKRAMLYFTQPSTRTFLSFSAACQILGLTMNEVRDPSVSSEAKGETPFDSMRMFSSYFDLVIMRSRLPKFAECCAYMMNELSAKNRRGVPIVNAGSGADEHPTQALLDVYTLQRAFAFTHARDSSQWTRFDELRRKYTTLRKGLDGKSIAFCGDIRRGRTVRSLAQLLALYSDITLFFIAPPHPSLSLPSDLRDKLMNAGVTVHECTSFHDRVNGATVIEQCDALYMTRVQKEHDSPQDALDFQQIDFSQFCLTPQLVSQMKEYAAILHPFPRDKDFGEIPTEIDHDDRAYYFRQARNGMWIRAALLAHLFDVDGQIADYHEEYTRESQLSSPI